ncbi:MAG: TIGR02281 family clan AA aspartic protease [Sphingopyxis sp.]
MEWGPNAVYGIVAIIITLGGLMGRGMPLRGFAKYSATWLAIGGVVYGLTLYRSELGDIWARARADLGGSPVQAASGGVTSIRRSDDGHFWVDALVNGHPARFLVDSGATVTALNAQTARAAGVAVNRNDSPIVVETANGLINTWPGTAQSINVGSIRVSAINISVSDVAGSENLLGMNWLDRLGRWHVDGDVMTFEPR